MPIVPSGAKRLMQAQSFGPDYPMSSGFGGRELAPPESAAQQPVGEGSLPTEEDSFAPSGDIGDLAEVGDVQEGPSDIGEYISQKLQGFGYPPRRLEEFESEFVKQKFFPGDNKEVTVVIPDRYYGTKKSISDDDLNEIIQEITEKFGLSFIEGEKGDKKVILEFMSQRAKTLKENGGEEEKVVGDELDEIYGNPKAPKKGRSKKADVPTTLELLKLGREQLIAALLKQN